MGGGGVGTAALGRLNPKPLNPEGDDEDVRILWVWASLSGTGSDDVLAMLPYRPAYGKNSSMSATVGFRVKRLAFSTKPCLKAQIGNLQYSQLDVQYTHLARFPRSIQDAMYPKLPTKRRVYLNPHGL